MKSREEIFVVLAFVVCALMLPACATNFIDRGLRPLDDLKLADPNASYFDRSKRSALLQSSRDKTLLKAARSPRDCARQAAPEPVGFLAIPPFYGDRAGYTAATAPLRHFQNFVTDMAEFYLVTHDAAYARCVVQLLEAWADKESLLHFEYGSRRQAWYDAVWTTVSAGFAYSIIRDDAAVSARSRQTVDRWLNQVARKHHGIAGGQRDCCNNHSYWRGLETAVVGTVTGDRELFLSAAKTYRRALASLNEDGSFPFEMERGARAIHYQNFAILPLVYIAEIASRQGVHLYPLAVDGKSLSAAIGFLLDAIHDPTGVKRYTDKPQDLSFLDSRGELNWMEPYNARFPDRRIESILAPRRPVLHRYGGGNSTLYFYRPQAG